MELPPKFCSVGNVDCWVDIVDCWVDIVDCWVDIVDCWFGNVALTVYAKNSQLIYQRPYLPTKLKVCAVACLLCI